MVNDSVASCRKSAAEAIKVMLSRLTKNIISTLYDITLTWLEGVKVMRKKAKLNKISKLINILFFLDNS